MDDQQLAWDMYFATVVGWQFHPGRYGKSADLDLEELSDLATKMLEAREAARYARLMKESD